MEVGGCQGETDVLREGWVCVCVFSFWQTKETCVGALKVVEVSAQVHAQGYIFLCLRMVPAMAVGPVVSSMLQEVEH